MTMLNLSDDELLDAVEAARLAGAQADAQADKQNNPRMKAMFDGTARRYRELADKFERARYSPTSRAAS